MENHHAINGKIRYVYGHFQVRKLLVSLPEGNPFISGTHSVERTTKYGKTMGNL